jgi:gas vesicle protein
MASAPARTADDLRSTVKSLVDRIIEADVGAQIAKTGREMADAVVDATQAATSRAAEAWDDSKPHRRDAEKALRSAGRDAAHRSSEAWRRELRPRLRDLWKQRTLAMGAAGAAVPASRELVDAARVRLGIKRREQHHWGAFFLGLLLGAAAGAIVAILTAPKAGREMRVELASRAREASDWVPLFQREGARAINGSEPTTIDAGGETPTESRGE